MKAGNIRLLGSVLALLLVLPVASPAQTAAVEDSETAAEQTAVSPDSDPAELQAVAALLKEQNRKVSGELRRIQREIAALRADLDQPGMRDVFAGIGYILGLFGAAAFVAARRKG